MRYRISVPAVLMMSAAGVLLAAPYLPVSSPRAAVSGHASPATAPGELGDSQRVAVASTTRDQWIGPAANWAADLLPVAVPGDTFNEHLIGLPDQRSASYLARARGKADKHISQAARSSARACAADAGVPPSRLRIVTRVAIDSRQANISEVTDISVSEGAAMPPSVAQCIRDHLAPQIAATIPLQYSRMNTSYSGLLTTEVSVNGFEGCRL